MRLLWLRVPFDPSLATAERLIRADSLARHGHVALPDGRVLGHLPGMTSRQVSAGTPPKSRFEKSVETLANGLAGSIAWSAEHGVLFAIFALLWAAVGLAIVLNPTGLSEVWQQIGALPIVVQLILWLLFLPVMAGVWVWQTDWPEFARIAIVVGLAAFTLLVMRPTRKTSAQAKVS
jgi:hypothetical protein